LEFGLHPDTIRTGRDGVLARTFIDQGQLDMENRAAAGSISEANFAAEPGDNLFNDT
jgi:hypothetical protein